jgi:tetratricopeptide (TPR) repeat protein
MAEISLQEYYGRVEDMIDQGRYAQAVAHGKHILGAYPKYVAGYRLLGRAMLEARRDDDALDMFLRVLSANPEDMLSWVAMSEIYDRRDELAAAVWCLERAFELSVDNQLVGEELRQLYGRRDGVVPERVELTRGALARLYLKGDLLSRSVSEFRTLLDEQPDRVDLEVAFAEALWRNEQRLEASEVCQRVLDKLPYCLKANLLLGEIWVNSGREEGQTYLRRAEALDPQNVMAQALFGDISPLPAQDVRIAVFDERKPSPEEERPAWMTEVEAASTEGPPLTEGEAALVDIAAALEAQIEIPSWLEEIDVSEAEAPEVPAFMAAMEEPAEVEEPALTAEEEAPGWMAGGGEDLEELGQAEDVGQEGVAGEPDWLAGVGVEPSAEQEEMPGKEKVPDFLSEMEGEAFAEEPAPSEEAPDWLAGLREQAVEDVREPAPADIPDWMQELAPSAEEMAKAEEPAVSVEGVSGDEGALGWTAFGETEVGEVEEPVLGAAEGPAPEAAPGAEEVSPPWLEGAGMPSGEEALAWLEQLAAGKEEELQAQVEAEVEARTAEIMGRPKAEAPAAEEVVAEEVVAEEVVEQEPAPAEVEAPPEPAPAEIPDWVQALAPSAEEAPEAEEAFGWTAFGESEAGVPEALASDEQEVMPVMGEAAPEAPSVPSIGEPPSVEEAPEAGEVFGWTAFGEPDAGVPGALASDGQEVMPVMGEAAPEAPSVPSIEEPPSVEEAPEAGEVFGWTAFGEPEEAPAERVPISPAEGPVVGEVPPPSVVEEVVAEAVSAPVVEELVPDEVGQVVAPSAEEPETPPAVEVPAERAPVQVVPPAEVAASEERAAPAAKAPSPPKPKPSAAEPTDPFAAEKAYLKENPRDYDARLKLARALWQAGRRREALEAYGRLVRAGKELDVVTTELEGYLEQWPDVSTQRVLGDAYMKNNQLEKALALYRQALESL